MNKEMLLQNKTEAPMSFKTRTVVLICFPLLLSGCWLNHGHEPIGPRCTVQPYTSSDDQQKFSGELNADLTKIAAAPVSADLKAEIIDTAKSGYQAVSDKNAACYMLLTAATCAQQWGNKDIAQSYIGIIRDQQECRYGLAPLGIRLTEPGAPQP